MRFFDQMFTCVFVIVLIQCINGATKIHYYALHSTLFSDSDYTKELRPADNDTIPTPVFMMFTLLSLVEMNEKEQTMTISARLDIDWPDVILSWNPDDHGGIESLLVPQGKVWIPDIVLGNGVKTQEQLGSSELPVRLSFDGVIDWQPTVVITTSCTISITYFPFDTQECSIVFETAMSTDSEVRISVDKIEPISSFGYNAGGQWRLINTTARNLRTEQYKSRILYTFVLSRRRIFYLITIIIPVICLSFTSPLLFVLPRDAGEKMSIGITVLLAFAVYLSILADLIPQTSLQVSILGLYLTLLLGLAALSLICCVFVLRIHFRDDSTNPGQNTTRLIKLLRKLLCMTPSVKDKSSRNCVTPLSHDKDPTATTASITCNVEAPTQPEMSTPLPTLDEERMTWQEVAVILDWFCFFFFVSCSVMTTVGCLLSLEIGSTINGEKILDQY